MSCDEGYYICHVTIAEKNEVCHVMKVTIAERNEVCHVMKVTIYVMLL